MKTQLKTITVSYGFVVAYTPDQDPEHVAREHMREALADLGRSSNDVTIRLSSYPGCKPSGWEGGFLPYGGDNTTDEAANE